MHIPKRIPYGGALTAAILMVTPFGPANGQSAPVVVTRYCSGCHGLNGVSQLPYVPRLAGIGASYLDSKFASYRAKTAPPINEIFSKIVHLRRVSQDAGFAGLTPAGKAEMVGVARLISEEDAKAAIEWYATREPAPGKSQKGKVVEEGEKLYTSGQESKGIQACQSCHGPGAEGTDTVPRLAGQHATYVFGQLALFRSGERRDSPMVEIARYLETDQAHALSTYLQSR